MGISRPYVKFQDKAEIIQDHLWSIKDGKKDFKKYKTNKQPKTN